MKKDSEKSDIHPKTSLWKIMKLVHKTGLPRPPLEEKAPRSTTPVHGEYRG